MIYIGILVFLAGSIWLFINLMKEFNHWRMLILLNTYNALYSILESNFFVSYHREVVISRIITALLIVSLIYLARYRRNKNKQVEGEE